MTAQFFDLTARPHTSRTLGAWLGGRDGGMARAGFEPLQNSAMVSSSDSAGMRELFAPIASSSGVYVNDRTAMQVGTVYACLSKLAGSISQLPLNQYRHAANGDREEVEPTPLWWLLNESPAEAWTAASWKEWIVRCVALRGDQHTEILRTGPTPTGFKVHHPDNVSTRTVNGRLRYDCIDRESGRLYGVDQDDMLHFAGLGFDGERSLSMISHAAKQAIGNAIVAAEFVGRTLGEGAMPQIALTYPNKLDPDQAKLLRDSFVATYGGTRNRKLPLIMTEGGSANVLSISPVDLELMAMRSYEKNDICQAMGVPPIIIGESEKTSAWGTGIEQIMLGFVLLTIKPHIKRWQEELNRKLFRRAGQFVAFDLDELRSGDAKSQAEFFRAALGGPGTGDGWMTVNETRRKKNLPAKDGGDTLFKAQAKAIDPKEPKP